MTRDQMDRQVGEELNHIPNWPGEHQGELRMIYNMARRRSLGAKGGKKQSAKDILDYSVQSVRERHPTAQVNYDRSYFG